MQRRVRLHIKGCELMKEKITRNFVDRCTGCDKTEKEESRPERKKRKKRTAREEGDEAMNFQ